MVEYYPNVVVTIVYSAGKVAQQRPFPMGGHDCENADVIGYVN